MKNLILQRRILELFPNPNVIVVSFSIKESHKKTLVNHCDFPNCIFPRNLQNCLFFVMIRDGKKALLFFITWRWSSWNEFSAKLSYLEGRGWEMGLVYLFYFFEIWPYSREGFQNLFLNPWIKMNFGIFWSLCML